MARVRPFRHSGALDDRYREDALARRMRLLETHGISLVLDVGANRGQYARGLRELGYRGRIVSFEPVGRTFDLLAQSARRDRRWTVEPFALGRRDGMATIHVSGDSRASSMLEMLPALRSIAPVFAPVGLERVPIRRLDSVFDRYVRRTDRVLLKLDVQGLEPDVLAGARTSLRRVAGIQLELSLVPLYRRETPMLRMLARLERAGFALMSLEHGFCNPFTARMLQVDGVLFRPQKAGRKKAGRPSLR